MKNPTCYRKTTREVILRMQKSENRLTYSTN